MSTCLLGRSLVAAALVSAGFATAILTRTLDGVDGLLGMNALRGFDVRLDRDAQELTPIAE
jgi:hypothetical protein